MQFHLKGLVLVLSISLSLAAPVTVDLKKNPSRFYALNFEVERNLDLHCPFKKRGTVEEIIFNQKNVFYISYFGIGSHQNKVGLLVDTGSAETWVPTTKLSGSVLQYVAYDYQSSATYTSLNEKFYIDYFDKTVATGNFATDDFYITQNEVLINFQFGNVDYTTNTNGGILGVGKEGLEMPVWYGYGPQYQNFPYALKSNGLVDNAAYSIFLGTRDANSGTIIFGGKDLAKIDGELVTLPMSGDSRRIGTNLNSITLEGQTIDVELSMVFDTGSSYTHLPKSLQQQIIDIYGSYNGQTANGYDLVHCPPPDHTMTFNFAGVSIEVPMSELVIQGGLDVCALTIIGRTDDTQVLGDNFLRHIYTVIDLEESSISIGKIYYTTISDIVPL
jgi:candidapepsin